MRPLKNILTFGSLFVLILSYTGCSQSPSTGAGDMSSAAAAKQVRAKKAEPLTLPVEYQSPSFMVGKESQKEQQEEEATTAMKVGASIRSTHGPQPLWDIMKRLAALKQMNVSWASDVDQNSLVDVDISANEDYFTAIDNLLRQVDYYHEVQGNTIVVKYKETRRFHIAMPFTKQNYKTGTGGNVLGGDTSTSNVDGTIELKSAAIHSTSGRTSRKTWML